MLRREFLGSALALSAAPHLRAAAPDWPQWRGPNRDGISTETGLLGAWPSGGPKLLWAAENLGKGYGTVAIAGDRIYVQAGRNGSSCVLALNRASGKLVWEKGLGQMLAQDRGDGPRATPTVVGDRIYAMSENGDLACLNAANGAYVWTKNILKDYGGENPHWNLSESPLVDGNKVVVTPGGSGAGMVAIERMTGKEIWRARELSDSAGYASIIAADIFGQRVYMNLTAEAGVGVRASDGKLLWRNGQAANGTANCTTPVYANGKVFYTSDYGTGCVLLEINDALVAREVYFSREMKNHHGGVILVNGYLYGFSSQILTCMKFDTGQVMWRDRSVGKGSLTYADGKLYLLSERNTVGLAQATHEGYKEISRFTIPDSGMPSWAYPVVCDGRLYLRNQGWLACYQIRA